MPKVNELLHGCLYFTANALARVVARMAEEEFHTTGLSPSHAFLLMLAIDRPDIPLKELGEHLHLAPSTITRFVDSLVHRGLLERVSQGRSVRVCPTDQGRALEPELWAAWKRLHERYCAALGREAGDELALRNGRAAMTLEP
jgi:DNA-binding MarR family transcriptional regulator